MLWRHYRHFTLLMLVTLLHGVLPSQAASPPAADSGMPPAMVTSDLQPVTPEQRALSLVTADPADIQPPTAPKNLDAIGPEATANTFTVVARDAAGDLSPVSNAVTASTTTALVPGLLSLFLSVTPDPVFLSADQPAGQSNATITLTVMNRGAVAHHVTVTAATPAGAVALPGPGYVSDTGGWSWSLGTLDSGSSQVLTARLQVRSVPPGQTLLVQAQATADELTTPVTQTGGAWVEPPDLCKGTVCAGGPDSKPTSTNFSVGAPAALLNSAGTVAVAFPAQGYAQDLTLTYTPADVRRLQGGRVPPDSPNFHRGLKMFFLDATDKAGNAIHQFDHPLTISVKYTPELLRARGIPAGDLTLFWYDEAQGTWLALPTQVDEAAQTASAQVTHFSPFNLSDGSSPSAAYIPSVQGFQASLFTGAAEYSIPIEVPAGAGGLSPNLQLSYSSAASDGTAGARDRWQAGWAGKGWNLNAEGFVARNKSAGSNDSSWDHFTLVFGGRSFDVVRGQLLCACDYQTDRALDHWSWQSVDENFVRVRAYASGSGYIWKAWTKDGTRYEFTQSLWNRVDPNTNVTEEYKWLLTAVVDPSGNKIAYSYQVDSIDGGSSLTPNRYLNPTYKPTQIVWAYDGGTPGTGNPRYKVELVSASRWAAPTSAVDQNWEYYTNDNAYWQQVTAHEAYRLDAIKVWSCTGASPCSSWQLMRQYNLRYAPTTGESVQADSQYGQKVLTLLGVQRVGKDGSSALPETTFTYNLQPWSNPPPNGWNRLLTINNGQGGRLTFSYEHVWSAPPGNDTYFYYVNYYRLTQALREDIAGRSYSKSALTTYAYSYPALNGYGYAATVVYAQFPPSGNNDSRFALARQEKREFRGHFRVVEQTYDGATTAAPRLQEVQHWFYQGNGGTTYSVCSPNITNGRLVETDSCYLTMRDRESWKGREFQTEVHSGGGTLLKQTQHAFTRVELPFFGSDPSVPNSGTFSNNYKRAGLWRAFNYESQTNENTYEGNGTPKTKTTRYYYDPANQAGNTQYGNLTKIEELDNGSLVRRTQRWYNTRDDTNAAYIVERMWGETINNGGGGLMAVTHLFYDGGSRPDTIGTRGLLTRQSKYYDVPLSCCPTPIHSSDTTYAYDAYGNQTGETTYAGPGTYTSSSNSWSGPGGGSATRTTTITYDDPTTTVNEVYSGLPRQVTNPLGHVEKAGYDYRMGTLTSVTDPNNNVTSAVYDVFGRIVKLIKPGDSSTYPTVKATYVDSARPFRYQVEYREVAGQAGVRTIQRFYDGLGRAIQTRSESENASTSGADDVVVDTVYDALNRATQESQPRYAPMSSSYSAPPSTGVNWTTTTYDGLSRPLAITAPGNRTTSHQYGIESGRSYDDITDPNGHHTRALFDALGRRVQMREDNGAAGIATTTYSYDPLDQLTGVTDAQGNVTSMQYDSLGRKSNLLNPSQPAMRDPDMGGWNYAYDVNGNLTRQTDARGQRLCFAYDALDRLIGKQYNGTSDTCPTNPTTITYTYDQGTNGKGHRTAMTTTSGGTQQTRVDWTYDARGRTRTATYTIAGLSGTRGFDWAYDSADRVTTLTYPAIGANPREVVTYSYDAGWRPITACTSLGGCYVGDPQNPGLTTYSPLDQPTKRKFSNGVAQTWTYESDTARLDSIQVGTLSTPDSLFKRNYDYDPAGNVTAIVNEKTGVRQSFTYDERDRLRTWTEGAGSQEYRYNAIGNLIHKAGVDYSYPATGSARPHTPTSVGGSPYGYDANGNLTSGSGRNYTWNAENLPTHISQTSGAEDYTYDGDGERVKKVVSGTNTATVYLAGLWEEIAGGAVKKYFTFNGAVVAVRDSAGGGTLTYLHGDHLGSVSLATNANGGVASQQEYDPWGKVRPGGTIGQTSLNYTGQRLDGTGLLYYGARYYDPALGRFVSADSVVPGSASGSMDGIALKPLTVDFHEPNFVFTLNAENEQGFWFQMSDEKRQKAGSPWGPANPQALNRYSYVQNNPLRYTDPTGHAGITYHLNGSITVHLTHKEATYLWELMTSPAVDITLTVAWVLKVLGKGCLAALSATAGEVGGALLAVGGGLALADWLYGSQGLDITISAFSGLTPGGISITSPTVARQKGIYDGRPEEWERFIYYDGKIPPKRKRDPVPTPPVHYSCYRYNPYYPDQPFGPC